MRMPKIFGHDKTFTQSPVWLTTFFIVAFHIGALAALFLFSWKAFLVAMGLWWVAGGFPDLLGRHTPQTSPEHGQGRRPALSARRRPLGSRRLASHRRNHA